MILKSKKKFIELIAQVFSGEMEKTYEQINIERTLRGEDQFILEPKHLKQFDATSWLFGFMMKNCCVDDLTDTFIHGFKHNWFYHDVNNEDYLSLLNCFIFDLVTVNNDLFSALSDHIINNFPDSELRRKLITVAYATGFTDIDYFDMMKMHQKYSLSSSKKLTGCKSIKKVYTKKHEQHN